MSTVTIVMLVIYVVVFGGGSVWCVKKSLSGNKQHTTAEGGDGFGSRIGFILSTIGMAVGVGAMWRFPMLCAKWGGGAFVLAFILITVALVIPAGFAEIAYGRLKGKEHMSGMREDGGIFGKILGALCSIDQLFLWAYYPAIQGLVIAYIIKTIAGGGISYADESEAMWESMNGNRALQYGLILVLLVITAFITVQGVKNGIEKICKIMLPALGVILVVLVIGVCTIDGIAEGIEYYVKPDWAVLANPSMWADAAGMALFAVGLGPGILYAYGRYTNKEQDVAMDFVSVNVLQLAICLMSGFVIIPAVKVFGFDPMMGKGIMFVALPKVFQSLPGGAIFLILFYVALLFAGISSSISQLEVALNLFTDKLGFKMSRKKGVIAAFCVAALVAIPCAFSDSFFAVFDTIIGSIGYDICALGIAILIGWKYGAARIRENYNATCEIKWGSWVDVMYKYVFVIVMAFFTIQAITDLF